MIKSMTGFGRCEVVETDKKLTIEMKSVNHRYLDLNIKMPKKFNVFESDMRNLLKNYASRGKIDIYISFEDLSFKNEKIKYNSELAKEYVGYFKQMGDEFGIENDMKASVLAKCQDVLCMEDAGIDEEEIGKLLEKTLSGAADMFVSTREREGEHLKKDMIGKLDHMLHNVDEIEKRSPEILNEYRKKLEDRLEELLTNTQIDENRIAAELVIFADKICVDEETVRLRSHIEHMKKDLDHGGEMGRKLDFIAQEMNREANTILSKANDIELSNRAIELKTEIEKIREQIQNIE